MDVCGPLSLEQLDLVSPSLDALAFSLDDPIWSTACIRYAGGAGRLVLASSTFGSTERTAQAKGSIGFAAKAVPAVIRSAAANDTVSFSGASWFERIRGGDLRPSDRLTFAATGLGGYDANAAASAVLSLTTATYGVITAAGFGTGSLTVTTAAEPHIDGEGWVVTVTAPEAWVPAPKASDLWTLVSPNPTRENWNLQQ